MSQEGANKHKFICEKLTERLEEKGAEIETERENECDYQPDIIVKDSNGLFDTPTAIEVETSTISKPEHIINKVFDAAFSPHINKLSFGLIDDYEESHNSANRIDSILTNPFFAHSINDNGDTVLYTRRCGIKTKDSSRLYIPTEYGDMITWIQSDTNEYYAICEGEGGEVKIKFEERDGMLAPLSEKMIGKMKYNRSNKLYELKEGGKTHQYEERKKYNGNNAVEHEWKMLRQPILPPSKNNSDVMTILNNVEYFIINSNGKIFNRKLPLLKEF